jgi:hypothetical protein
LEEVIMRTVAIILALGLSLSGCELVKKIQNRRVMAGAVIRSPAVVVPGGTDQVEGSIAYLFLGERQDDGTNFSQNPPTGLSGATVTLSWDTSSVTLAPVTSTPGQYQDMTSVQYVEGAKYTFAAALGGDTYTGSVTAPSAGTMEEFPPSDPVKTDTFSTFEKLTITRVSLASDTLAFYAVLDGDGTVTCTNGPTQESPMKLVDIFLNPEPYKAPSFELFKTSTDPEKSCFPSVGPYVVELTTLKSQDEVSDNLFLGSSVFAGTASAGVLVLE